MKKMFFSKRIVFVYTIIVIIPLLVLVFGVTYSLISKEDNRIRDTEVSLLDEKCKKIEEAMTTFDMIESITLSDAELTLFLARPESLTENELINTIISKSNYLEQVCEITPDIYSIRIFSNNQKIPERWPIFLNSRRIENEEKLRWNLDYRASYLGNQNSMQFPSFCTTRPIIKGVKETGWIQISFKMETVFPFLYENSQNESYLLLQRNDDEINIIKSSANYNNLSLSEKEFNWLRKNVISSKNNKNYFAFGKMREHVCWQYIEDFDVFVVRITSFKDIRNRYYLIIFLVMLGCFFTSITMFFVIRYATGKLMAGVYSVMDGMKQVKDGNYSVQIPVDGTDEVSETQEIFNSMTQQLASQIQQIKTEQSLIAETEMKAMQNQINAHFLYNVLETIRMQAVLADQDDMAESLQVLGKMMRYCLRWRIHRVSLAQEIDYIKSYIYILNVRNDYVINLQIDIDDSFMDIEIPKMVLQPLIENAFVHAIEKEERDASLRVYSELSEDGKKITLSVQDFGCGMSEEQVEKLTQYLADDTFEMETKGSIGLKNIQQRLTVFYGADYRISIKSKLGEGTVISVPIPLKEISKQG